MSYPSEIIEELTLKFSLDGSSSQLLRETLLIPGVRQAIEAGDLSPDDFCKRSEFIPTAIILSPQSIKTLVTVLPELKKHHPEVVKIWIEILKDIMVLNSIHIGKLKLKRQLAIDLSSRLLPLISIIPTYPMLLKEYSSIASRLPQYMNALQEPIQHAAISYFQNFFPHIKRKIIDFDFTPKKGGVQLGAIITIKYVDENDQENKAIYHVKTHQHGNTSEASSAKPVDLKELFIYKLLEYSGYGPKAHFFHNPLSVGGFYIATQDLAFTKSPKIKSKRFTLFEQVASQYNSNLENPAHDNARGALIKLDILSRILRIRDTTTNPDNFGYTTVNDGQTKWKLLDFRILSEPDISYLRPEIFEDFCSGNGTLNCDYADFLRDIFKNPEQEIRKMQMATECMIHLRDGNPCQSQAVKKMPLLEAIERSFKEIETYTKEHHTNIHVDPSSSLEDLHRYEEALKQNFQILFDSILQRNQELQGSTLKL